MIIVAILFFVFMMLGMPIAFAIGISGFVYFLQQPTLVLNMPVQLVLTHTQHFVMLSIPLFVLAGNLLNETAVSYPHLDVYKRQGAHHPLVLPFECINQRLGILCPAQQANQPRRVFALLGHICSQRLPQRRVIRGGKRLSA